MILSLTADECWAILINQYALLPICPPLERSFLKGVHSAILRFKSYQDLQEADVPCTEGDLWHLTKVTDPSMRFGTNPVGQSILLKVFELMPQEGLILSEGLESALMEALHDNPNPSADAGEGTGDLAHS